MNDDVGRLGDSMHREKGNTKCGQVSKPQSKKGPWTTAHNLIAIFFFVFIMNSDLQYFLTNILQQLFCLFESSLKKTRIPVLQLCTPKIALKLMVRIRKQVCKRR